MVHRHIQKLTVQLEAEDVEMLAEFEAMEMDEAGQMVSKDAN